MSKELNQELITAIANRSSEPLTPMHMLQIALENKAAIDVIERLAALQEKAMARDAEIEFNEAMNLVQGELGRVTPDLTNPQTKSKYASYAALDRIIRPIYTKHGFSLSFDTADAHAPDMIRAVCYVSKGAHVRRYQVDMPADGKGAKGGDVMTKTHASGAAMSYGMRYLLKFIFNVAIGEDDSDGNGPFKLSEMPERLNEIRQAPDVRALAAIFQTHYSAAKTERDANAMLAIINCKDDRKAQLQ